MRKWGHIGGLLLCACLLSYCMRLARMSARRRASMGTAKPLGGAGSQQPALAGRAGMPTRCSSALVVLSAAVPAALRGNLGPLVTVTLRGLRSHATARHCAGGPQVARSWRTGMRWMGRPSACWRRLAAWARSPCTRAASCWPPAARTASSACTTTTKVPVARHSRRSTSFYALGRHARRTPQWGFPMRCYHCALFRPWLACCKDAATCLRRGVRGPLHANLLAK